MKKTFVTWKFFDSLETNTMLTLEQAQWYMQGVGEFPLPKNCTLSKIKVIFCDSVEPLHMKLKNSVISKIKISPLIAKETNTIEGYIYVMEISYSAQNHYYILKGKYKSKVFHYALSTINQITKYIHKSKKAIYNRPHIYKLTYSLKI